MGWLSLMVVYQLAIKLAMSGVTLLAVGGVVYSLGVIFCVCKRMPYNHAIWHESFVLERQRVPLLAIYLYVGRARFPDARAGWRRCRTLSRPTRAARASLMALRYQAIRLT